MLGKQFVELLDGQFALLAHTLGRARRMDQVVLHGGLNLRKHPRGHNFHPAGGMAFLQGRAMPLKLSVAT